MQSLCYCMEAERESGMERVINEIRSRRTVLDHGVAKMVLNVENQSGRITLERGVMLGQIRAAWMSLVASI